MHFVLEIQDLHNLSSLYYYNHDLFKEEGRNLDEFRFVVQDSNSLETCVLSYSELPNDIVGRFDNEIFTWSPTDIAIGECLEFEGKEDGVKGNFLEKVSKDRLYLEWYNNASLVPCAEPIFTVCQLLRYQVKVMQGKADFSDASVITDGIIEFRGTDRIVIHGNIKSYVYRITNTSILKQLVA